MHLVKNIMTFDFVATSRHSFEKIKKTLKYILCIEITHKNNTQPYLQCDLNKAAAVRVSTLLRLCQ